MQPIHEPRGEFIDRLELQIIREVQRHNRAMAAPGWHLFFKRPRLAVVTGTVLIALTVGAAVVWRPATTALYRVVEGAVRQGETIQSDGDRGAVLALVDGSRIEMRSHTDLSLDRADDGLRIRLNAGGIIVNAAEQRTGHLYVQTKDMTVSVVGTVFLVSADEQGSRVAVIEGEVRVQQGSTEQKLLPGEQVATDPSLIERPVREAIAWSRNAAGLSALLQQSSVVPPAIVPPNQPAARRDAFEVVSIRPSGPAVVIPGARGGGGGGLNSRPAASGCVFDSFGYSYQIDPRRFAATRITLLHLAAYTLPLPIAGLPDRRPDLRCGTLTEMGLLAGGPDWIRTDPWDVVAAIPEGVFTRTPTLTDPALQQMLRTMLADRFGWVIRRETREVPVYLLKVGKDGPKFNGSIPLTPDRWGGSKVTIVRRGPDGKATAVADLPPPVDGGITVLGGNFGAQLSARNVSMTNLANHLFGFEERPVLDRTGLTGRYDFHYVQPGVEKSFERIIKMTVLEGYGCCGGGFGSGSPFLREVLTSIGLELEEARAPFDAWVIERAQRPTEN
ncbi:MAG: TIGR03435 family protein [Vicinamibacterales bacterium]